MGRATFDTMSEFGTFLPFVASQHHGRYRGYRRHVTDGAGRPSLTHFGLRAGANLDSERFRSGPKSELNGHGISRDP